MRQVDEVNIGRTSAEGGPCFRKKTLFWWTLMGLSAADILHECKLFSRVEARGFQRLVVIARMCKFRKAEMILRQDDWCEGVYVVGSGLVRVFKSAASGKEHVLHIVGPGGTFAEAATIGQFRSPANVEAVAPTTCVLLPAEPFEEALREDHELCLGMMTGMTLWVRHLVGLMEDIVLRDAAGRLARFLLQLQPADRGPIELPVLKRHVASHLNLTSETFSRTLRRLAEAELITLLDSNRPDGNRPDGNRVVLTDPEKLRLVAEGLFPKL